MLTILVFVLCFLVLSGIMVVAAQLDDYAPDYARRWTTGISHAFIAIFAVVISLYVSQFEYCTDTDQGDEIRELWSEIHALRAQVIRSEKAAITAQTDSLMAKADSNLADHKSSSANKSISALAVELKSANERIEKLEEKLKRQERNGKGSNSKPQVPTGKL